MLKLITVILSLNFVYFVTGDEDYCNSPCYTIFGMVQHSACSCDFGPKCKADAERLPPDAGTQKYIVHLHNTLREKVASGKYKNCPRASNMAAIVYDQDLEHVAECFASKCIAGHDKCRTTEKFDMVGQNVARFYGVPCDSKRVFNMSVQNWFDEIKTTTPDCIKSYSGCSPHYTQIVWAETTSVGCARVLSGDYCFVVCNYGPAANFPGEPVYDRGAPHCRRHKKYPHLCKMEEEDDTKVFEFP